MRANLLRAVSHDLRTPLTTIYGASSSIIDNYDKLEFVIDSIFDNDSDIEEIYSGHNVVKSYKARTTKGKSLGFLCLVLLGYIAGISSKLLNESYMMSFSA